MDLSVLIPTAGRVEKLCRCVAGLAQQTFESGDGLRFEVLIGIDGADSGEADAVAATLDDAGCAMPTRVIACRRGGPAATRNTLLERARAPIALLLNDDVVPEPGLIAAHVRAQRELAQDGREAMVLGAAPWVVHEPDRLFDRLIRETSMVFFYDRMTLEAAGERARDPDHDWGFRHAWTLNLSLPVEAVRAVGGFDATLPAAGFEDLELAWRLAERRGMPVLYRPEAVVRHDHRYEPEGYLEREHRLGRDAWALAACSPACAQALFGRDVRSAEEIDYSRAFVSRELRDAHRLEASFMVLASMPATAVQDDAVLQLVYQQHLLLKRWYWRRGLLEASDGGTRTAGVMQAAAGVRT